MKKLLVLPLLFLLASCENKVRNDGYKFGQKQYEQTPVTISVVTYKTEEDLVKAATVLGANYPNIAAFSVLTPNDHSKCTIHMIDPAVKYQPEFVGHEFLHCVYGQWHTDNDSRG